ncbi:MAG TPA: hypothetical protein VGB82_06115 [Alphaproteobacteria bacterium]
MQRLPTGYSGCILAVFTVLTAAAVAGCSDTRPTLSSQNFDSSGATTYTSEGMGTRGGTNVDGAGPGGPRDPYRYTRPPPYNPAVPSPPPGGAVR